MKNKKEIDLIELVVWCFKFVKKYILLIILFTVIGLAVGISEYYLSRNYYSTTLIVSSPVIDNQIVYELFEPVKYYLRHEMYDSISKKFEIEIEVARGIRSIELDTSMIKAVKIELQLYDKENIGELKDGLLRYMNSNPFVVSSIQGRREDLEKYLNLLNNEISDLNSLQVSVLKSLENGNSDRWISAGGMFNEMMDLSDKKLKILNDYNTLQYFSVLDNNMVFEAQKNLMKNLFVFTFIGVVIGFMLSIVLEISRLVRKSIMEEE